MPLTITNPQDCIAYQLAPNEYIVSWHLPDGSTDHLSLTKAAYYTLVDAIQEEQTCAPYLKPHHE